MFGGSANLGTLVAVMRMDTTAVKQAELQLTAFGAHVNKVMLGVGSAMAAVFTVRAVTNMAKGFMNTAVEMEKYRTSLVATIKDADKANEAFHRMYEWAAANPVDVDEAVASFVRLKTAAVKNSEEMVKVLADAALVMHQPVTVAANAVISTNAQMLRKLGVQVDRTGKQAIVRSGNFRVAVTKDIDSIRAAILDALKHQFGGAMKEFGDTWSGTLKTIRGQYQIFQSDVMGSAGDGGPFDTLRKMIVQIREEWIRWRASSDYTAAVKGIQAAIVPILEFISNAYVAFSKFSNLVLGQMDKIALVVKVFLSWKVINGIISGVTLALTYFRREVVLIATGTSLVSRFASAIATWKLSTGIVDKLTGSMIALFTPQGAVMAGVTALIWLVWKLDDYFKKATRSVNEFSKELRNMPLEKVTQIASGTDPSYMWRFTALPMLEANTELVRRREEAAGIAEDAMQSALPHSKRGAIVPDDGTSTAIASKVSKYVGYIQKMKDEVKYLGANAKDFLVTLDAWASKLKPLSDDWKLVKDYSMEIRAALSKEAGKEAADTMKRLEEQIKLQKEAREAAEQGVEKFWSTAANGFSQGLIKGQEYFQMLTNEFEKLKEAVNAEAGGFLNMEDVFNWSDQMLARFSELQSVGEHLALLDLSNLNEQLKKGVLSQKKWNAAVQELLDKYSALPAVVEKVNNAQKNTKKTSDEFGISAKLWANDLAQGLAQAIVNAEDLGDALRNIAKSIAGSVLQKLIGGWIGGLFADGAAFQDGRVIPFAKGGIVTKPTIFPMARGMGLMGEAGPEAVMPLTRTAGGELGVKAEGNGGMTNITININAVDSRSFVEMMRTNRASVESIVVENIMKNGAVRAAMRGLA